MKTAEELFESGEAYELSPEEAERSGIATPEKYGDMMDVDTLIDWARHGNKIAIEELHSRGPNPLDDPGYMEFSVKRTASGLKIERTYGPE